MRQRSGKPKVDDMDALSSALRPKGEVTCMHHTQQGRLQYQLDRVASHGFFQSQTVLEGVLSSPH